MNTVNEQGGLSPIKRALLALREKQAKIEALEGARHEPIAIIGQGCRFPGGVNSPAAFWQLLSNGVDATREVPADRWDIDAYVDASPDAPGKMSTRYGGFLSDADKFDAHFFGISPREAVSLDPQQRLLLEVSWEALEHAGVSAKHLFGSSTGVFIGISSFDYAIHLLHDEERIDPYVGTGSLLSPAAGRLSYLLGLTGPSMVVDTACSSSLVALDLAVMKLRNRECDLALAGGVNMLLAPSLSINFSKARMLAPDGRCKTFDARANGYVRAEGCGIIVLKRLSDALASGDNILALIRGTAVNQDGASGGLTVPSGPSQVAVIRQALKNGRVEPSQVSYIEAHGTGTSLGDPIEVGALGEVFRQREHPLLIGSVKTNIGHLEAAAGIAGIIKVVLALQHQEIPPHLHFEQPNPHIEWDQLPVKVPTERTAWPRGRGGEGARGRGRAANSFGGGEGSRFLGGRIAGVSSFGFSGTNAHVILEEAPASERVPSRGGNGEGGRGRNGNGKGNDTRPLAHLSCPAGAPTRPLSEGGATRPLHLLTLSAKTQTALHQLAARYEKHLATESAELPDICFTANAGRSHFKHRYAVVAADKAQMMAQLSLKAGQSTDASRVFQGTFTQAPQVAFLFTGQGSQYVGMGQELYETQLTFRKVLDECDEIWRSSYGHSLIDILFGGSSRLRLNQTAYTQVALFALEYALAKLWQSWGVVPDVVMGHSVGELVAACVAGVFSLEDGLKLVAERGRLMQSTALGQMVAIFAPEAEVKSVLGTQECSIAAINGPQLTVISGTPLACQQIVSHFEREGIKSKKLNVSHAFHSPLMTPILEPFREVAKQITFSAPRIALISNLTGEIVTHEACPEERGITTAEYWVRHIRQPVRFVDGMKSVQQLGIDTFVEIGPKATLLGMGRRIYSSLHPGEDGIWLPSLRPNNEWPTLLGSVAQLYVQGVPIDWAGFDQDYLRRKVDLPTYPFQRERYWIAKARSVPCRAAPSIHPLVHTRIPTPKQVIFESKLSANQPAYLADHRISGTAILPASAYLEMVLAAAAPLYGTDLLEISDVSWTQALIFRHASVAQKAEHQTQTVQIILTPDSEGHTFEIFSLRTSDSKQEEWLAHASGKVKRIIRASHSVDLESLKARYAEEVPIKEYYQELARLGIDYGPSFQAIERLFLDPKGTLSPAADQTGVLGRVRVPEALLGEAAKYNLHPVLLDACFQLSGAILGQESERKLILPFALESLQLYAPPASTLWVQAKGEKAGETLRGRVKITCHFQNIDVDFRTC